MEEKLWSIAEQIPALLVIVYVWTLNIAERAEERKDQKEREAIRAAARAEEMKVREKISDRCHDEQAQGTWALIEAARVFGLKIKKPTKT